MADSPPPETLAWLHQSATVKGSTYSQVLLHLLERVEALEQKYETQRLATLEWGKDVDKLMRWIDDHLKRIMALEQPHQDKLDRLIKLDSDDEESERLQWYTYDPEEGIELYSSREQAQSAAESIMGSYQVNAYSDGWHEDMEMASWGALAPVEQAQIVARGPTEPGDECDEWIRYELRPARWSRPATPPPRQRRSRGR
jgi:hypothetical protein